MAIGEIPLTTFSPRTYITRLHIGGPAYCSDDRGPLPGVHVSKRGERSIRMRSLKDFGVVSVLRLLFGGFGGGLVVWRKPLFSG